MTDDRQSIQATLDELTSLARELGASEVEAVSSGDVSVEDELANLCRETRCESYGLSTSCPPNVSGPDGFRELLRNYEHALVFKIDIPTEILHSFQRRDVFILLHEIASGIEHSAVQMGHSHSKAFAGGSCKRLFCQDHKGCRVLTENGECRNPQVARPSMSGFGINVHKLMQSAGWAMERITSDTDPEEVPMGTVCGLVLIG